MLTVTYNNKLTNRHETQQLPARGRETIFKSHGLHCERPQLSRDPAQSRTVER